jgi:hypothetical protein
MAEEKKLDFFGLLFQPFLNKFSVMTFQVINNKKNFFIELLILPRRIIMMIYFFIDFTLW